MTFEEYQEKAEAVAKAFTEKSEYGYRAGVSYFKPAGFFVLNFGHYDGIQTTIEIHKDLLNLSPEEIYEKYRGVQESKDKAHKIKSERIRALESTPEVSEYRSLTNTDGTIPYYYGHQISNWVFPNNNTIQLLP